MNLYNVLYTVRQLTGGMSPDQALDNLKQSNPKFKEFMDQNAGKTPEEIAKENGIDIDVLKPLINYLRR